MLSVTAASCLFIPLGHSVWMDILGASGAVNTAAEFPGSEPEPVGPFVDVPVPGKEWMQPWIEHFRTSGLTTGCGRDAEGKPLFCPERETTRAEMAVFLLRASEYPNLSYTPPARSGTFADVPVAGKEWMEPWVEEFYLRGITSGCGADPLAYCPERPVTRAETAVFVLRALNGGGYQPPVASGSFADVPAGGKEWMEPWIEQFYALGITSGCGYNEQNQLIFCPERPVTRAEVAVFILRAFDALPKPEEPAEMQSQPAATSPDTPPTPTPGAEPTEEVTPAAEPTQEPVATETEEPAAEPTEAVTSTPGPTGEPAATPTPTPTEQPATEPTAEVTASPEPTHEPTPPPATAPTGGEAGQP